MTVSPVYDLLTRFGGEIRLLMLTVSPAHLPLCSPLTWLWTVFSWLLKVMVRLVDVLGATCVMKGVLLWFTVSYMFTRRLQISMFWKHDLTLFVQKAEAVGKGKKVMERGEKMERRRERENNINAVRKNGGNLTLVYICKSPLYSDELPPLPYAPFPHGGPVMVLHSIRDVTALPVFSLYP